jgi:formylglycine-generating enzyme required for sulfatase activity
MKKLFVIGGAVVVLAAVALALRYFRSNTRAEALHYEREETELIISNDAGAKLTLFKAGNSLQDAIPISSTAEDRFWLPRGNYFLKVEQAGRSFFYPIPIVAYRSGPDKDGNFGITVRLPRSDAPHGLLPGLPDYAFVPSGSFLFGDRLRVQEPHYVWLGSFYIFPFEVTNAEFREFLIDPRGYGDETNWTEAGKKWKATSTSHATALLKPTDTDYKRFGQPDLPVVQVNWFEANAFCHWLTKTWGRGRWIFALPTEAEWEKAARGPDNFDYALGMNISDNEAGLYNWRKNPGAPVTVVGREETKARYTANRYGIYHLTGNVAEWTQSIYRPYSRRRPYLDDDDRNKDETSGERVLRGGSWYTASVAVLYISYRENFQPEVQTSYLGFRVVARPVP